MMIHMPWLKHVEHGRGKEAHKSCNASPGLRHVAFGNPTDTEKEAAQQNERIKDGRQRGPSSRPKAKELKHQNQRRHGDWAEAGKMDRNAAKAAIGRRIEPVLDIIEPALPLEPVQNLGQIHVVVCIRQVSTDQLAMRINKIAPEIIEKDGNPQTAEGRPEHRSKGPKKSKDRLERHGKSV